MTPHIHRAAGYSADVTRPSPFALALPDGEPLPPMTRTLRVVEFGREIEIDPATGTIVSERDVDG